jgi:hypothetical protein
VRNNPLQQNPSCRHSLFAIAANAANAYKTYLAFQQAEAAFRALYCGRPLDLDVVENRPSAMIVQRHWSTVEQLAETFLCERALAREQVLKLLLEASLDEALTEPQQG